MLWLEKGKKRAFKTFIRNMQENGIPPYGIRISESPSLCSVRRGTSSELAENNNIKVMLMKIWD